MKLGAALIAAVVLAAAPAETRPLLHYDLAGLLLHADAVVVVDRLAPGRYRVVRALWGTATPGAELAVDDSEYDTHGRPLDPRAVLVLAHRDGKPELVASGLRVLEGGKVFRFEQLSNPGLYQMVPQGRDPIDEWVAGTPQLGLPELERAVTAAARMVDQVRHAAAATAPDVRRAIAVDLMPPSGDSTAGGAFFVDELAVELEDMLIAHDDLDGALMVASRDRGGAWWHAPLAPPARLLAYAAAPGNDPQLRAIALDALVRERSPLDQTIVRGVIALIADPVPAVRIAAIARAARVAPETARAAIAAQYAGEADPRALGAAAEALVDELHATLPARAAPRFATVVHIDRGTLGVELYCLRPERVTLGELTAAPVGGGAARTPGDYRVHTSCETHASHGGSGHPALPAGSYALTLAMGSDTVTLGTLDVDAAGELRITR